MPKGTQAIQQLSEVDFSKLPEVLQNEIKLLRGFKKVVWERVGYNVARKLIQSEMSEKVQPKSKRVQGLREDIAEGIEKYLNTPEKTIKDKILTDRQVLETARKDLAEEKKPFIERMKPLVVAVKYIDNIIIPDYLKTLNSPVQPIAKLSPWIVEALAQEKEQKKKKKKD